MGVCLGVCCQVAAGSVSVFVFLACWVPGLRLCTVRVQCPATVIKQGPNTLSP